MWELLSCVTFNAFNPVLQNQTFILKIWFESWQNCLSAKWFNLAPSDLNLELDICPHTKQRRNLPLFKSKLIWNFLTNPCVPGSVLSVSFCSCFVPLVDSLANVIDCAQGTGEKDKDVTGLLRKAAKMVAALSSSSPSETCCTVD